MKIEIIETRKTYLNDSLSIGELSNIRGGGICVCWGDMGYAMPSCEGKISCGLKFMCPNKK